MNLENHLQQLPKHSLEDDLWGQIERKMNQNLSIAERLPLHKANSDLWYSIEEKLQRQTAHRRSIRLRQLSIAASIVLVISLGTVFLNHYHNQDQLYFSEEIYMQETSVEDFAFQEAAVLENCHTYPAVCESPDFTRLKSNLDALKLKEQQLRKLKQTVNEPKMELYHSRIVKEIQEVEAEMLEMFS